VESTSAVKRRTKSLHLQERRPCQREKGHEVTASHRDLLGPKPKKAKSNLKQHFLKRQRSQRKVSTLLPWKKSPNEHRRGSPTFGTILFCMWNPVKGGVTGKRVEKGGGYQKRGGKTRNVDCGVTGGKGGGVGLGSSVSLCGSDVPMLVGREKTEKG